MADGNNFGPDIPQPGPHPDLPPRTDPPTFSPRESQGWLQKALGAFGSRRKGEQPPVLGVRPDVEIIPPSFRSFPERPSGLDRDAMTLMLSDLLKELSGRRDGYRFYTTPEERRELVQISERTADYLHDNNIRNFVILDRAARPAYIGVKEAWKKKYPNDPLPDIYFLNPTGFVNDREAARPGITGLPKGLEIIYDGMRKGNDVGAGIRSQAEIEQDFVDTYKRLMTNRDQGTLLFDSCIHSGDSVRSVRTTLRDLGFQDLKVGVVGEDMNNSGIRPDFVAVRGTPLGVCYPFDRDRMVERRFDSVTSAVNPEMHQRDRERSVALRDEIRSIVAGTPPKPSSQFR